MQRISIIIVTLNSSRTLNQCLASIRSQNYPQELIEILIVDGGSTDTTIEIAHRFNANVIFENTGSPEAAKAIGLQAANGTLIADFGSDNILPNKDWLNRMVAPFALESKITGSYPWRYTYRSKDTVLNRYFALFGVNDPVPYYLKKADRQSWIKDNWDLLGKVEDKGDYFLVEFSLNNMPTLGANGFFIRKDILKQVDCSLNNYFHIDIIRDVIELGYNSFAVVKTDIIHDTGERLYSFLYKRKRYMEELYIRDIKKRRYHIYSSKERITLLKYITYSIIFIEPLIHSIKGYLKIQDYAWFIHPIMCFFMVLLYGFVILKWKLKAICKTIFH